MTVRVRVQTGKQIIVPVRFARAVTGAPVADAPEIDDRGFAMGARAGGWGSSTARGAMVGITEGDTVRIRLLREDIDAGAPLFITSTDTGVVRVIAPAGGGPVPANGIFQIRGVRDLRNRPVQVQVRLGSTTGPVLGDLEPHVFRLRRLRVRVHLCRINGTATARTAASLTPIFTTVNAIWRPCGIQFRTPQVITTPVTGFAVAGAVTTNLSATPPTWAEFSRLINTRVSSTRINIYCVRNSNDPGSPWNGLTFDRDAARPNGYGIVLPDAANANDFAHELGHFLNLDQHSDEITTTTFRQDMWARRCLMFRFNPYGAAAPAHRNNVGYGANNRGALITVKNLGSDARDGELARARRRARNPY